MNVTELLPEQAEQTEAKRYPLHLRDALGADHHRLADLTAELGFSGRDIVWIALEENARLWTAMRAYRAALEDLGAVRPLPNWQYSAVSF